jgi:hypothetical protein
MDDTTLGGYQHVHGRPPAFGAPDGHAYSVATFTGDSADHGGYGAALLFVRWSEAGQPMGHLETDYLAFGSTPDEALAPVLALTLEQVKTQLDGCVARQRA